MKIFSVLKKMFQPKNQYQSYRASLENPNTPLSNPAAWLTNLFGGGVTDSGIAVNEQTALKFSAVYSAVRVLAETVASLPLVIYEETEAGKELMRSHPAYSLLHDEPNKEMTSFSFRETLQSHLLLWGNAFAFIDRRNDQTPTALLPLLPDRTFPERMSMGIVYRTRIKDEEITLRPDQVLHIPGLGFDGLQGFSPISLFKQAIGLGLAAEEFGARFFGSGSTPSGVLNHPGRLSEMASERLRKSWNETQAGLGGAHKIAILEEGMKWQPLGIPGRDAQFIETRKFQVNDIARIFRVPPHMIGDLDRATFSNVEQQSIDFVKHSVRPWLVRWEQEINRKLFASDEKPRIFAKFKIEGMLRGDIESRFKSYATARQYGWMSANDIRELEDMNKINGGDIYLIPLNMTELGKSQPDEDVENLETDELKPFLEDIARRFVRRELGELERIRRKKGSDKTDQIKKLYEKLKGVLTTSLEPVTKAIETKTGTQPKFNSIEDQILGESEHLATQSPNLLALMDEWKNSKIEKIVTKLENKIYEKQD